MEQVINDTLFQGLVICEVEEVDSYLNTYKGWMILEILNQLFSQFHL